MLCDVCKTANANVFLTQIVEGKMQKVNMCEACSKEKGVTDPTGFALADLLLGIGAAQPVEGAETAGLRCANCGLSQGEFKKAGRLGCSSCYTAFSGDLEGMLKGMHKGPRHVGKAPERRLRAVEREKKLRSLNAMIQTAVSLEQFESAASIRDLIRALEAEAAAEAAAGAGAGRVSAS